MSAPAKPDPKAPPSKTADAAQETGIDRLGRGAARILGVWDSFQLLVWVAFLTVFPPLCAYRGMWLGATICAVLGLLASNVWLAADNDGLVARSGLRRPLRVLFNTEHLTVLVLGVWGLTRPVTGWTNVPGSQGWSNPSLVRDAKGKLAVISGKRGQLIALVDDPSLRLVPAPGGLTFTSLVTPRGDLWLLPRDDEEAFSLSLSALRGPNSPAIATWRRVATPGGMPSDAAASNDTVWAVFHSRAYRLDARAQAFRQVPEAGEAYHVCTAGDAVLVVGAKGFASSSDAGVRFTRREAWEQSAPLCALARDGWAYAGSGGMWSGWFRARAPGDEAFVLRPLPATDVREIAVDPRRGQDVFVATWGEGVFASSDGGLNWRSLGLEGLEARSLEVDPDTRTVTVAAANMAGKGGLWRRTY